MARSSGPATRGRVTLDVGSLDRLEISIVKAPYLSVMALMKEVLAHTPRGLPNPVARRIDRAVSAAGRTAMDALSDPRRSMAPRCIYPGHGLFPQLSESIIAMRDASTDSIAESITSEYGDRVPLTWRQAAKSPRAWISAYA